MKQSFSRHQFTNRATGGGPEHARRIYLAMAGQRVLVDRRRRRRMLAAVAAVGLVLAGLGGWWVWTQVQAVMTGDAGPVIRLLLPSMLGGGGWLSIRICRHH